MVARVTGDDPGLSIDLSTITESVVSAGPGLMEEDDVLDVLLQAFRSGLEEGPAGGSVTVEWEFTRPYSEAPSVVPAAESAGNVSAVLVAVTASQATLRLWNNGASPVDARVVATAHGVT